MLKKLMLVLFLQSSALACSQTSLERDWGLASLGKAVDFSCINAVASTILIGGDNTGIMYGDLSSGRLTYKGSLSNVFKKVSAEYKKFPEYKQAYIRDRSQDLWMMGIDMPFTQHLRAAFKGYEYPDYLRNARLLILISEGKNKPGYVHVSYLMYTPNP